MLNLSGGVLACIGRRRLLVVVIIIGILAAIAIPVFLAQRERAQQATCESDTRNAAAAVSFGAETDGDYTDLDDVADLTANDYNASEGVTVVPNGDVDSFTLATTCDGEIGTAAFDSNVGRVIFTAA